MKSILIADDRADLLATLEPILKHWGYRVISTRSAPQVSTFLEESAPCLLIISEKLLTDSDLAVPTKITGKIKRGELPVIALKQEHSGKRKFNPDETLEVPVELFELFSFIQAKVENHPRQNLRLRLKLPGMYSTGKDDFILADVLSLSMQGLFFKAQSRLAKGSRINVVFPLYGQCKEIEVNATVLYTMQPEPENNFSQGFGVGFDTIPEQHMEQLQRFIKDHFLQEVSSSHNGVGDFTKEHLRS